MTNPSTQPPPIEHSTSHVPRPSVGFDWKDWLPHLVETDIPDDQKRIFIETLWSIVLGFVDLGFEIKAPAKNCGETINLKATLEAAVLNSGRVKEEDQ